jgi:hypothetical protein
MAVPKRFQLECATIAFLTALLIQHAAIASNDKQHPLSPLPGATLVDGQQAPFLQDTSTSTFRVYAFHGDTPEPIPFQVDERDRRDRWVADLGPRPNHDDSPGVFDANDAIVVMNRDLGRRGDLAHLPHDATLWGEIRVGNDTAPLGFAYVGVFESSLPPLSEDGSEYSRYEPQKDRVYAERYALEFTGPLPTHVAFVNQLNDFGTNVVNGIHASGEVRFLGGLFTLRRTEADIQQEILGYRDGPVRVIRRARYWIPLPFGFRTSGRVDLLFYRDFAEGTAFVKLKIPPRLVFADGELLAYFDFLDLRGARLLLEGEPPSDPIDGSMTLTKQTLAGRLAQWAALLLPDGRTMLLSVRLEGALQKLTQHLYFDDARSESNELGHLPLFGFKFSGVQRLESGAHRLSVIATLLDETSPEGVRRTARLFLSPPEVSVSQLKE